MSSPVTQQTRSEILESIKEGMTIVQAAELHGVTSKTISKWMRQSQGVVKSSNTEIQKLKKEIEFLKSVILEQVLEKKAEIRKG